MKTKQISGQIMVIVLLLLSILSIIALTATLTTVKDTQEQVQNKQYQQYYSLGEGKILDIQRYLGNGDLSKLADITNGGLPSETGSSTLGTCILIANNPGGNQAYECTFNDIQSSDVNTGTSAETFSVYTKVEDTNYIVDYQAKVDSDLLLELTAGSANDTYIMWKTSAGSPNDVAWGISYDYKSGSDYITDKVVYEPGSGPFAGGSANADSTCVKVVKETPSTAKTNQMGGLLGYDTGTFAIKISVKAVCQNSPLYFRIRPYRNSKEEVTTAIYKDGNSAPLQRTISTVTTSNNTSGQASDTPTSVLKTNYLLTSTPLNLFDYVLRTEGSITKN